VRKASSFPFPTQRVCGRANKTCHCLHLESARMFGRSARKQTKRTVVHPCRERTSTAFALVFLSLCCNIRRKEERLVENSSCLFCRRKKKCVELTKGGLYILIFCTYLSDSYRCKTRRFTSVESKNILLPVVQKERDQIEKYSSDSCGR
jgi:hypothetical protein